MGRRFAGQSLSQSGFSFSLIIATLLGSPLLADCLKPISGVKKVDVASCVNVQPEQRFSSNAPQLRWLRDLDATGKKQLFDSYRGMLLEGRGSGLGKSRVKIFVHDVVKSCQQVRNRRWAIKVEETCCQGAAEAPCMLGTSFSGVLQKDLGVAAAPVQTKSVRGLKSKAEKAGDQLFQQRRYVKAAKSYQVALKAKQLTMQGYYRLGQTYRKSDRCPKAVKVLDQVYRWDLKGSLSREEVSWARKSIFLLARCYGKLGKEDPALAILNGYLTDVKKYRKEIRQSFREKDLNGIRSGKGYREYETDAKQRLNRR